MQFFGPRQREVPGLRGGDGLRHRRRAPRGFLRGGAVSVGKGAGDHRQKGAMPGGSWGFHGGTPICRLFLIISDYF